MTGRLSGHHVLVTAARRASGPPLCARRWPKAGRVTAVDRNGAALDRFAASLGHPPTCACRLPT